MGLFNGPARRAPGRSKLRLGFAIGAASVAALAPAELIVVHSPAELLPTDQIVWAAGYLDASTRTGVTRGGISYRVTHSAASPASQYNGRYIIGEARPYTVLVEFDRPIAAIGAEVSVAGLRSWGDPYKATPTTAGFDIHVAASGYYGLLARGGWMRSVRFTASSPITLGPVDLRPVPLANPDAFVVTENTGRSFDALALLGNDAGAEGAAVVQLPSNASAFCLNEDGSFAYTPKKDFNGEDSFTYSAVNGRGTSWSEPVRVTIKVLPANSAPSFLPGPDLACDEDAGPQTISNWAREVSAGGPDEAGQALTWELVPDRPDLFSAAPAIGPDGTLTYTPADDVSGSAVVYIRLRDDGGAEGGGADASPTHALRITVNPLGDAPRLHAIRDAEVHEGGALLVRAAATEQDFEQAVEYSLEEAPEGASIDLLNGTILWKPEPEQAGRRHRFVVRATERTPERLSSTVSFEVNALKVNKPPIVREIGRIEARAGQKVSFHVRAKDEGGEVRYALGSEVEGPALHPKTGKFVWTPKWEDVGRDHQLVIFATDSHGLTTMRSFVVRVPEMAVADHAARPRSPARVVRKRKRVSKRWVRSRRPLPAKQVAARQGRDTLAFAARARRQS